jgi:hypothetical protein
VGVAELVVEHDVDGVAWALCALVELNRTNES